MGDYAGPEGQALLYPKRGAINLLTVRDLSGNDIEFPWSGDSTLQAGYVVTPPGGTVDVNILAWPVAPLDVNVVAIEDELEPLVVQERNGTFNIAALTTIDSVRVTMLNGWTEAVITLWFDNASGASIAKVRTIPYHTTVPPAGYTFGSNERIVNIADGEGMMLFGTDLDVGNQSAVGAVAFDLEVELAAAVLTVSTVRYNVRFIRKAA